MNRFRALDIARGVAILGTLGTNIWIFTETIENGWISIIFNAVTNGKFLGLLTLMFGIGMQLKCNLLESRELPWLRIYLWSMVILFTDGLLHYIFVFEFDVLMSYALVGALAAILITRSRKVIVVFLVLALSTHLFIQMKDVANFDRFGDEEFDEIRDEELDRDWMMERFGDEELESDWMMNRFGDEELFVSDTNSYWQQIQYRLDYFWENRDEAIMIIPMNLALFLTGALLVQAGLIGTDTRARRLQKYMLLFGVIVGLPLLILSEFFIDDLIPYSRYVIAPLVAIAYLGFIFLWERTKVFSLLQAGLQNVGKMALSCYIGQNIICSIIFYEWGFGVAPVTSDWATALFWCGISLFLMVSATVWLHFFKRGPFEMVWKKVEKISYPKEA